MQLRVCAMKPGIKGKPEALLQGRGGRVFEKAIGWRELRALRSQRLEQGERS